LFMAPLLPIAVARSSPEAPPPPVLSRTGADSQPAYESRYTRGAGMSIPDGGFGSCGRWGYGLSAISCSGGRVAGWQEERSSATPTPSCEGAAAGARSEPVIRRGFRCGRATISTPYIIVKSSPEVAKSLPRWHNQCDDWRRTELVVRVDRDQSKDAVERRHSHGCRPERGVLRGRSR
jgi:hypothetical protein